MRTLIFILGLVACASEEPQEGGGFTWSGGEFDFQTTDADDACLGGALEVLFMPNGPETPQDFEYSIYLPSYDELPMSYAIDLREPFVGMEVTVREGPEGGLSIRDSIMESVELGVGSYGDCVVTMSVDADFIPNSATAVEGIAIIEISDPRGSEERCPVLDSDPCDVELNIEASAG
jgi:hypothetical protein